ncbi:hypothetical protein [Thalassotalea sp. PLHSN55]|uniref:hypothetical protein n=1 Tax=Thalassotalea sp. PLHSN55 TaxID=3435888 RepID=UPI003F82C3CF
MKKYLLASIVGLFTLSAAATPVAQPVDVEIDKQQLKTKIEQSINKELAEIDVNIEPVKQNFAKTNAQSNA